MAVNSTNRGNSDYMNGNSSSQETQPSPLAMLAATCSKIGSPAQNDDGSSSGQGGGDAAGRGVGAGQGAITANNNNTTDTLTTTGWVQLPNGTIVDASGKHVYATNLQPTNIGNNVGANQLFAQGQQIVATPGPNGQMTYSVVPSYQTVSFDGQEAFFMPQQTATGQQGQATSGSVSQNMTVQNNQTQQTLVTPTGQIIRAQGLATGQPSQNANGTFQMGGVGNVVNIGGNLVSLGGMQNTIRPSSNFMPAVQIPGFQALQQVPPQLIQIPVSMNGQTVLQTVQLQAQNLALQSPLQQINGNGLMTIGTNPQNFQTIMATQGQTMPQAVTLGQMEDNSQATHTNSPVTITQQANQAAETQKAELKPAVIQVANQAVPQTPTSKMAGNVMNNNSLQSLNLINTGQGHVILSSPQQNQSASSQALPTLTVPSYPQTISSTSNAAPQQSGPSTVTASSTAQNATLLHNVLAQQQLLQGMATGQQGLGGLQLAAGQNQVWLQQAQHQAALSLQSPPKAQAVTQQTAGMPQALHIQNLQNLQNLQALQALQGIQHGIQAITSQGQYINGGALSGVNTLTLGSGNNTAAISAAAAVPLANQQQVAAVPLANQQQMAAVQPAGMLNQQGIVAAQIQQDPSDPTKWQIVSQTPQPANPTPLSQVTPISSPPGLAPTPPGHTHNTDTPTSGRRLKRLACTCPNCISAPKQTASTGEKRKQHICHIAGCGKVYGKTSHLRAHLRWHSGDRPFVCSWLFCGKRFTRSDELQRHKRTHTGEKKFQCPECNKRFMRSDHLSKHIRTHNAKRLYPDGNDNGVLELMGGNHGEMEEEEEEEEEGMMGQDNKVFRVSLSEDEEEEGGEEEEEEEEDREVKLALVA